MNIKAEEAALRKLSLRSMGVSELEKFLKNKGFSEADISEIIDSFIDYGYLNDARYSSEVFRMGFSKNRSIKYIKSDLRQKGVSGSDIQAGLDMYVEEYGEPNEYEMAKNEAMKVLRDEDSPVSDKLKGRVARRLAGRGFSTSIIYDILGNL